MSVIAFQIRADALVHAFGQALERQVPFAVSSGLNKLANIGQAAEREGLKDRFDLRRETFNLQGIKIEKADRATKTHWRVVISLEANRSYLDRFEEKGIHEPFGGRPFLWVPNAQTWGNRIIQARNPLHPKNIKLDRVSAARRHYTFDKRVQHGWLGGFTSRGQNGTYMVESKNGHLLILQRIANNAGRTTRAVSHRAPKTRQRNANGRNQTRILYTLKERVRVPLKLEFVNTIREAVEAAAPTTFTEQLFRALRTA